LRRRRNVNYNEGSNNEETNTGSVYSDIEELIRPQNVQLNKQERESEERYLKMANKDTCQPCSFTAYSFTLKKHAKACQVYQYELKKPKWKDVVLCPSHGVRLCLAISPPRAMVLPHLIKTDGADVTDLSWTCEESASCWDKFHSFYAAQGLFSCKNVDLSRKKIKFGAVQYSCELYQKKYAALGITVKKKGIHSKGVGLVVPSNHWKT